MIIPTVGRIVHYVPQSSDGFPGSADMEPLAAIITRVRSDTYVNLCVYDADGETHGMTGVTLVQPGAGSPREGDCHWMPYQVKKESGSGSDARDAGTETI